MAKRCILGFKDKIIWQYCEDENVRNNFHCCIGIGFNIDNDYPCYSINNLMKSTSHLQHLKPLSIEGFIASFLNTFHHLIASIEKEGIETLTEQYKHHWLHTDQRVTDDQRNKLIVRDLDSHGYLILENLSTGERNTFLPDGNRFDMLHNLILPKK